MRHIIIASLSALLLTAHPTAANAQRPTVLSIAVADANSGAPIVDAEVVLVAQRRIARTNWLGEAIIDGVRAGRHRVRVRRLGYAPSDIHIDVRGDTAGAVFMLEKSANPLDTVRVVARRPFSRLEGFEQRKKMGFGRFLTEADLVVEGDREVSYAISGRIPGLRRGRTPDGTEVLMSTRSSCGGQSRSTAGTARGSVQSSCFAGPCPVRVLLDEIDIGDDVNFLAKTWDLAGVEYYSAANAPVQYRESRAGCGVLLLWSK